MRLALSILAAVLVAGCSTPGGAGAPLIPDKTIELTSSLKLSLAGVVSGALALGAIHLIYDPLAPNWEIEESRLADDTFRFSLKMKRYNTGGAGESMQVLRRRAAQLQGELGYGSYQLLEYSEGIESETFGARRVAEGTVRLVSRPLADSFLQN
ncbi:MAG TPA: hypothetical protein VJ576_14165 [Rhodocyclaceae bacterium]|nr:hypothetical protein [Rhodocyclaceae bacterium]